MINWIISSSVLILVIVVLRLLLKGKIPLRLQYALWALVLVRLLVPFSIGESSLSITNATERVPVVQAVEQVSDFGSIKHTNEGTVEGYYRSDFMRDFPTVVAENKSEAEFERMETVLTLRDVLMPVWICGVAVFLLVFICVNACFKARLKRSRQHLETGSIIPVYVTAAVETPCLFGFFSPNIYVTHQVAGDMSAMGHVLEHEYTHYRHGDNIWAALRCLCLALHWYNPLVWLAAALSRRDGELACDEGTIRRIGEEERVGYGRTLISLTCTGHGALLSTATTMTGSRRGIKERITLIAKKPRVAAVALILATVVALIAVGCTFTGAKEDNTMSLTIENCERLWLRSGLDGETVEITDVETINYITDSFAALTFSKDGSSEDYNGWSYWLKWYDEEDNLIEEVVVMSETRIDYNGYFYQSMEADAEIDIAYLERLTWNLYNDLLDSQPNPPLWVETQDPEPIPGVEDGKDLVIDAVSLTQEEINRVNIAFAPYLNKGTGALTGNPLCCFLTSYYDSPEQLDLADFLRYFPYSEDVTDLTEFEAVKAGKNWPFGAAITLENMYVPIHRIRAADVDAMLQQYAGISVKDLYVKPGTDLIWLKEYDAYYNFTSDASGVHFQCLNGFKTEDGAALFSEHDCLILRREGDRWIIQSFTPWNKTALQSP